MSRFLCSHFSDLSMRTHQYYYEMRGLSNYNLSCCVNSLLQSFSATWELGELLDKWEDGGVSHHNVPHQLKKVLMAMRSRGAQPAPHWDFLQSLHRNSLRLNIQHDADEVFLSILNLMQEQINYKPLASEIQQLFRISVETHLQCLECNSVQTLSSFLLNLPLHVKEDHDSLEHCMASFFEHQELTGINSCFCVQCGKKTPSKRAVKLSALPQILCVHLKRFRNHRGSTRKLGCRVTFPERFNFSGVPKEALSSDFAQGDCVYTLHAVVVHSGSAMCGHYTAYVRNRVNQRWYYADDSHVEPTSWEAVQRTYGGQYSDTAYMLMYRRSPAEERRQAELSG